MTTATPTQEILDAQSALALEALRMALAEFANEARTTDRTGGIHTPHGLRWLDGWVDGVGRLAQDAKHKGLWVVCVALRTAVMRLMSYSNRGQFKGLTQLEALSELLESYLSHGDVGAVLSALADYFESTGHRVWTLEDTERLTSALRGVQPAKSAKPPPAAQDPVHEAPPPESAEESFERGDSPRGAATQELGGGPDYQSAHETLNESAIGAGTPAQKFFELTEPEIRASAEEQAAMTAYEVPHDTAATEPHTFEQRDFEVFVAKEEPVGEANHQSAYETAAPTRESIDADPAHPTLLPVDPQVPIHAPEFQAPNASSRVTTAYAALKTAELPAVFDEAPDFAEALTEQLATALANPALASPLEPLPHPPASEVLSGNFQEQVLPETRPVPATEIESAPAAAPALEGPQATTVTSSFDPFDALHTQPVPTRPATSSAPRDEAPDAGLLGELNPPEEPPPPHIETGDGDPFDSLLSQGAAPAALAISIPAALPEEAQALVGILLEELDDLKKILDNTLIVASSQSMEATICQQAIELVAEQFGRFGGACQTVGLLGLHRVCDQVHENLLQFAHRARILEPAESELLREWLARVYAYLQAPTDQASHLALAEILGDARWSVPAAQTLVEDIAAALADVLTLAPTDDSPQRAEIACDADVIISIPQDVNPDLLEGLLQELPGQTEEFSAAIQRLLAGGTAEDLNVAQRIAHTVKGAGNTVGVKGIANVTHCLEDILLALAQAEVFPTQRLGQSLMNAADCLEGMCEILMQGGSSVPAEARDVYQEILDWANYIDSKGLPTGEEGPDFQARAQWPNTRSPAKPEAVETPTTPGATGNEGKTDAKEGGEAVAPSIRVPATLVDELLRLGGENIILTGQVRERLNRAQGQTRSMQDHFRLLQELGSQLEQFIDLTDLSANQRVVSMRDKFDALEMDQYSELHTYSRRLVESATDAAEMGKNLLSHLRELDNMLVNKERLNGDTQETVMRTRMVPVKTMFARLQRSVRQTCRLTSKQVDLRFAGDDTMMDSDVLNSMADPIMHLLRNAIDHGIEDEEGRLRAGKPAEGRLELAFMRDGNNIVIRCKDDGHGLDFDAIREKARSAGLLSAEQAVDEETLKRYILLPNFSTRKQATQTSGRGIGLDAVNSKVEELGGSLSLESKAGAGCTFDLRLPVTLISSHAVLVRMGRQVLAVANRGITQILHPDSGELRQFGEDAVFHVAGNTYPVKRLAQLLGAMEERRDFPRGAYPLILVQAGSATTAIQVEAVIESRDLVVKGFGHYLTKIRGVIGATILGDGSVTPVLDIPELLRAPAESGLGTQARQISSSVVRANLPRALVVDDSLSARRSLAQFMQDSGFEVRTARDGLEAIEVIESVKPDILLVDMEMPRMNGIELTNYVRSAPALGDLPIIMITSRSTAKHREQATSAGVNAYLTKPFADDELLEQVHRLRAPQ